MKITILGDIHGRSCWREILENDSDLFIFLGDYVSTHERISSEDQIMNLEGILSYKEDLKDKMILLRGNHDMQHLGYSWARCSGYDHIVSQWMQSHKEEFLNATQWIYQYNKIIFSHAGISKVWLANNEIGISNINDLEPSDIFGFTPDSMSDYYGDSKTQPLTWIRPGKLVSYGVDGYTQVVGHTPVAIIFNSLEKEGKDIWFCDCLPKQYLVLDNERFSVEHLV